MKKSDFNAVVNFNLEFPEMAEEDRKLEKGKEKKARGWLTLIYLDSEVEGWRDKLSVLGMQAIISPLHDKDLNATREFKKPHYHVMLLWEGPTTRSNAKQYVEMIGGVGCLPCATIRGSARYFCHLDNPDKHRYDKSDVLTLGGIDYDLVINSDSDDMLVFFDIVDFIERNHLISYRKLMLYCRSYNSDWAKLLLTKYRENVFRYMRSYEEDLVTGRSAFDPDTIKHREDAFETGGTVDIKDVELSGYILSKQEIDRLRDNMAEMEVHKKRITKYDKNDAKHD